MARRRNRPNGGNFGDARELQRAADQALNAFMKLDMKMRLVVLGVVAVVGLIAAIIWFKNQRPSQVQNQPPTARAPGSSSTSIPAGAANHLLLGNPSGALADPSSRSNYLMIKPYFALSYDDAKGTPNWVSWRVTRSDLGDAPRKQLFDPDADLPPGFTRVTHRDYSGGGFDRGHMCPHSDRAATQESSFATFVMTNIIPQAPNVNQKAWADMEMYCRDLVRGGKRLYTVAGPLGVGGVGSAGFKQTLANGKVTVPAECWKVVVAIPETGGPDNSADVTADARVIAVVMPNDNERIGPAWARYRTSAADIERRTGYRFFGNLPPDVAESLRRKVDAVPISMVPLHESPVLEFAASEGGVQ